ncbi:hypothetical protein ACFCWY_09140 [Streptomyces sp. NPDC056362]|uniref:hypothetical protein n=1 Tax=unclassified Streptomyces TaxID=2593676 RepID=UPI0035D75DD7
MSGAVAPSRARTPRKPTGLPNPPIVLLAGPELTGKSYAAAAGSGSDLVGMTYWVQVGGTSGTADYYGQIEGARYEIVPHDGSFDDIVDAIRFAVAQPPAEDGKRNMVVIDDVSAVWDLLSDEVAHVSRQRADRKAVANGTPGRRLDDPHEDDERDLWVDAKERWGSMLNALRKHHGPTLLIARQEIVTAFEADKPTGRTSRRIRAEKNLRASVDAVVEFHAVGEAYITGLHVMRKHGYVRPGWDRFDGVDSLLRRLGYQDAAATRAVVESRPEAYLQEQLRRAPEQGRASKPEPGHQCQPQGPNGIQIVRMVHQALTDKTDPEERLQAIRTEWGERYLRQVPVRTDMWGQMNAVTLITKSLAHVREEAEKRAARAAAASGQPEPGREDQGDGGQQVPALSSEAEHGPAESDVEHENVGHAEHREPEPAAEEGAPPPPDPQAEEPPPPGELAEETSQAEEPQDRTDSPPVAAVLSRRDKQKANARRVLLEEAAIQALVLGKTTDSHLAPVSENGAPDMADLRKYLMGHRPAIIDQLEAEGHSPLAASYRKAPQIVTKLGEMFAPYFAKAPVEEQ